MKYQLERDATLRCWEVFNEEDGGFVTKGVVIGEEEKGQRDLDKVLIPDSLLRFMAKHGFLDKYTQIGS